MFVTTCRLILKLMTVSISTRSVRSSFRETVASSAKPTWTLLARPRSRESLRRISFNNVRYFLQSSLLGSALKPMRIVRIVDEHKQLAVGPAHLGHVMLAIHVALLGHCAQEHQSGGRAGLRSGQVGNQSHAK